MKRSPVPLATTIAVLVFFYIPILFLVMNSFNASRFGGAWQGFSVKWYARLFSDKTVWRALENSLIIALISTSVSMVAGTLSAFAIHKFKTRMQVVHYTLIYTPLVLPDLLMGMSLLLFFVALRVPLGMTTIALAHITFCISYVTMVVLARLQDFDFTLIEAARDLGATSWGATRKILLPLLMPGILAGGMLAFTLSIDDFVITFFVSGPGATTLPIQIYSMIRHGSPAMINALSTILLTITFIIILISRYFSGYEKKKGLT
ncbi:MAG: ABC transporter permease [Spartobacteria bacterium]|nr:ABC transporter permease [Spartobacteria bacterium]